MDTIYLYPKVFPCENPYVMNLENSLSAHYKIINKKPNKIGVLNLFNYLFQADIFLFNWIENLPSRRFGNLQVIVFVIFLVVSKALGKKIVWIMHNKYSHDRSGDYMVDFMFNIMIKHSDLILTHSLSGVDFIDSMNPSFTKKTNYLIHPVKRFNTPVSDKKLTYDFFIWGTIWPYKGIIEFLKYLKDSGNTNFKILIAGICINDIVRFDLEKYLNSDIIYMNKFYGIDEIANFSNQAKFTLFTYKTESVLSSGSLMDSIGMGSVIIGPDAGAFKDLSSYKFVKTYKSYPEIIEIFRNFRSSDDSVFKEIDNFCNENSWENFEKKLNDILISNL
jgi:beta-1,4-mannosyltransferase